jgi:hypothetical protein
MRISSPWKFHSDNYNLHFLFKNPITSLKLLDEYWNPIFDSKTNEIMITFSKATSTINENNNINYCEVLFKYKVQYGNQYFYYPVITYVNHEYSLLRGYFLGFEKRMAEIHVEDKMLSLSCKDFSLSLKYDYENDSDTATSLPSYPFILNQDYHFDDNFSITQIVTLNVKDYTKIRQQNLCAKKSDLKNFIATLEIDEDNLLNLIFNNHEDKFEVHGVMPINT